MEARNEHVAKQLEEKLQYLVRRAAENQANTKSLEEHLFGATVNKSLDVAHEVPGHVALIQRWVDLADMAIRCLDITQDVLTRIRVQVGDTDDPQTKPDGRYITADVRRGTPGI